MSRNGDETMNIRSILFPTDFSYYNDAALEYASTLAAEAEAKLYIVHVHDACAVSSAMGEASYFCASTWQEEFELAGEQLARILPTRAGIWYEHNCLPGKADEEIIAFARDRKVDLIVMASHGRSGLTRLLMGSVAEAVMRKAPCPVLIVKQSVTEGHAPAIRADCGTSLGIFS